MERLDQNKDGKLSVNEIASIAPTDGLKRRVAGLIKKYDSDNDGMVDTNDVRKWINEIVEEIKRSGPPPMKK
ncbi:hypothetical protein FBUS_09953 [Fasciolopsis buskii]|uniref:EF-hand domain-containing protein n=1 Tax=Fasciolopsis buskii TaxID=27845 RepID=A0A8E0VQW7_9TREM|nr:hypothetical protein FBUS_09953 [Fasciolopsis buski]